MSSFDIGQYHIVTGPCRFWLGGYPMPRSGPQKGAVIEWSMGFGIVQVWKWGWGKR